MASEAEASCESDPNFAIICAFLEKFGETCGIDNIDFVELQRMLENNHEVSPELVNLHIKLLRKTKKKVIPERWERALINMCHSFSSKDAWEIERFGYKKTRLRIKLRALKELLEMQFDYNTKFKNDVNKMTAEELRAQPLGRDKLGRSYWFQTDNNYQVRVYKEDLDEETWNLIAKDREGLMSLITELTDGDSKLSSDSACNEDSNSLLEKPFIDTGQIDSSKENGHENNSGNEKENVVLESIDDEEEGLKKPSLRIKALSELIKDREDPDETSANNKKLKLDSPNVEISTSIETPTMIIQGEGSGVDNTCDNVLVSEAIEDPVFYVYGQGSGKDCDMGNEKDHANKESPSKSDNNESANHSTNNYKLGTIIDSKTDNKIFLPRDPNKKSRWDQKETELSELKEDLPKKPTFFFGPGSLNVKPRNVLNSEALEESLVDVKQDLNKKNEDETKSEDNEEKASTSSDRDTDKIDGIEIKQADKMNDNVIDGASLKVPISGCSMNDSKVPSSTINFQEKNKALKDDSQDVSSALIEENIEETDVTKDKVDVTNKSDDYNSMEIPKIESKVEIDEKIKVKTESDKNETSSCSIPEKSDDKECLLIDKNATINESSINDKDEINFEKANESGAEEISQTEEKDNVKVELKMEENVEEVDKIKVKEQISKNSEEEVKLHVEEKFEEINNSRSSEEKKDVKVEVPVEEKIGEVDRTGICEKKDVKIELPLEGKIEEKDEVKMNPLDQEARKYEEKDVKVDLPVEEKIEEKGSMEITEMDKKSGNSEEKEDVKVDLPVEEKIEEKDNMKITRTDQKSRNSEEKDEVKVLSEEKIEEDKIKVMEMEQKSKDSEEKEDVKVEQPVEEKIEVADKMEVKKQDLEQNSKNEEKDYVTVKIPLEGDIEEKDKIKTIVMDQKSTESEDKKGIKEQLESNGETIVSKEADVKLLETVECSKASLDGNHKEKDISQEETAIVNEITNKTEDTPKPEEPEDSPAPLEAIIVDTDSNSAAVDNTENDPLAVSDETPASPAKPISSSITNFSFDFVPSSPASDEQTTKRNLRKRGREETKPEAGETSGKKPKIKGKRSVDLNLRKSVEEKRQQEVGDASSDENETPPKKEIKTKGARSGGKTTAKVGTSSLSDTDNASVKSQPTKKTTATKNKRILKNLGLNEEDITALAESPPAPVRQSRRLAQLKIKEEASRRKMEEEEVSYKKKKKKEDDKDFKAGKRKRFEEEMKLASIPPLTEKKKKKKKHDKITIGWNTSSEDSDCSVKDEEEGSEYEYDDAHEEDVLQFKSDHEFSPESDLEGDESMPLKRARTARKEESDDDDTDEEFPCQKCGKADHPEWILLCDKCDNGWHCSCLRPALFVIPEGDWYCPTCQHENLLQKLHKKLRDFDKMMAKKEMEDRRKERLAYVGISLNNVLPTKEKKEKTPCKESGSEKSTVEEETGSESGSASSDKSDSDEPIYQLRQRRQANSYKFQDYDDLINSALQEEPATPVEKTHTLGRGKDIATIVNAAKEEEEKNGEAAFEDLPPVVPKDDDKSRKKAISYRKKPKRLNNLEVNSDDEADDSDEDFNGSSNEESDEDDFEEDSDDSYVGRKGSRPTRRSTRARTTRFDADFINDDEDDDDDDSDEKPMKKKKRRTFYEDSESELSDDWRGKKRSSKKSKKKKTFDDSDLESYRKKKPKIKYGIDNDDGFRGRRTRGKKTSYLDTLGSDSEEETFTKKPTRKSKNSTDDDEYVVEDDKETEDEEAERESEDSNEKNSDSDDQIPLKAKKQKIKKRKNILESDDDYDDQQSSPKTTEEGENAKAIRGGNSIEDTKGAENVAPPTDYNKKLDEINEEYVGKMMENEDYANKQLRLAAIRIQEAKRLTNVTSDTPPPVENSLKKVRTGRFFNMKPPQESMLQSTTALMANDDDNDELSEPPGVVLPIFDMPNRPTSGLVPPINSRNVPANINRLIPNQMAHMVAHNPPPAAPQMLNNVSPESKKRRGRGKGKKTLAAEAAAAVPEAAKSLAANIEIASPPQPFSQSQPTPSVITRMLQTTPPGKGPYPVGRIRPKQFAMMSDAANEKEASEGGAEMVHKDVPPPPPVVQLAPVVAHAAGHYGAPPPGQYVYHHQRPIHPYPVPHGGQPPPPPSLEQPLPLSETQGVYAGPPPPPPRQTYPNPAYNYEYNVPPPQPPAVLNTDDGIPPPVYENNATYTEPYDNTETNLDGKNLEDEPTGEFGGLVSYFSSQHEDDLDS